ncbi:MAG: ammonium transporter [Acidobacteria bacterium]|nr:ammonium transporter [Acidobacteriota bacterium]
MKLRQLFLAALCCALLPAQTPDADAMKAAIQAAQSAGDNAWMLVSAALVLMMTGPGLALFYGGLVRRKNVLNIMVQSFAMQAVITVLWAVIGYSLAFGEACPYMGGFQYIFLNGVGTAPNGDYAATIPQLTFMVYQMMFAIITPALITGAYAERVKFTAMLLFSVLWTLIVYIPLAHMIWGKGGLLNAYLGGKIPVFDFAGGTVVHISSGVSALVCALYLGKRVGYPDQTRPHSLVLCFIGACMLWVGWFGFNAGSALAASGLASSAFVNTHLASATGAIGWAVAEWYRNGRPSVLGIVSGSVAGLATITQSSGFVQPQAAMLIGLTAGIVCYYMVAKVKDKFGYDDSLDAFGVHGVGGTMGCLFTGVFATNKINDALKVNGVPAPLGWVDGNSGQIFNQAIGAAIGIGLAIVGTYLILKLCDILVGLRVEQHQEISGLDVSLHGEEGYNLES